MNNGSFTHMSSLFLPVPVTVVVHNFDYFILALSFFWLNILKQSDHQLGNKPDQIKTIQQHLCSVFPASKQQLWKQRALMKIAMDDLITDMLQNEYSSRLKKIHPLAKKLGLVANMVRNKHCNADITNKFCRLKVCLFCALEWSFTYNIIQDCHSAPQHRIMSQMIVGNQICCSMIILRCDKLNAPASIH